MPDAEECGEEERENTASVPRECSSASLTDRVECSLIPGQCDGNEVMVRSIPHAKTCPHASRMCMWACEQHERLACALTLLLPDANHCWWCCMQRPTYDLRLDSHRTSMIGTTRFRGILGQLKT